MLIDRVIVGSMYTNAYIVSTGKKECILIDPGADATTIIGRLEAMNLVPHTIVFTHGHIDHTSAARELVEYYAGRDHAVRIGIHESDKPYLGANAETENRRLFEQFGEVGLTAMKTFDDRSIDPDFFIAEGETLSDSDLTVMHTPGHSLGSICFYSEPRNALFSGDTLFFNLIGRTDFAEGDEEQLKRAVSERIFELPPETRVFPGHGPTTTIEREIMNNKMESEGATI
jgi:glyoxylase-like metal-dependent hydrolase (beta-lactamase superfamily II)